MSFVQDHRLSDSSFLIEDWPLCRVSLRNIRLWPWLYLVPRREGMKELHDLSPEDRGQLIKEISLAGEALQSLYKPEKINTAALGNLVPQLHIHVFARFKDDPAWPRPVWAVQHEEIPYTESERNAALQRLRDCFSTLRGNQKI